MKIRMRMPMKLKMSVYTAGAEFALAPGDVTERFSDAEAIRLIEKGYAVPVTERRVETAVKRPAEVRQRGKKRV